MFLKRVSELANYLSDVEREAEEVAKYLCLKTFSELSPTALYIAEITDDGYLSPVAGFGFEKLAIANWGRFPLSMHIPITDAVRRDECIIIDSAEEFFGSYPILNEIEDVTTDWEAVMAWPMLPFGVGFAILQKKPRVDEEFHFFLRSTGAVIALQQSKMRRANDRSLSSSEVRKRKESVELTKRQKVIYEMLCKGATNAEIALEIGYSESLVRQETIEIYRMLGVSGRKELITAAANA